MDEWEPSVSFQTSRQAEPLPRLLCCACVGGRHVDVNALMLIATVGALASGDVEEGLSVLVLVMVGDRVKDWCSDFVTRLLDESGGRLAPQVGGGGAGGSQKRQEGGREASLTDTRTVAGVVRQMATLVDGMEVPVEAIGVGAVVLVRAGEAVPVDGVVLQGRAAVDESAITGRSRGGERRRGDVCDTFSSCRDTGWQASRYQWRRRRTRRCSGGWLRVAPWMRARSSG